MLLSSFHQSESHSSEVSTVGPTGNLYQQNLNLRSIQVSGLAQATHIYSFSEYEWLKLLKKIPCNTIIESIFSLKLQWLIKLCRFPGIKLDCPKQPFCTSSVSEVNWRVLRVNLYHVLFYIPLWNFLSLHHIPDKCPESHQPKQWVHWLCLQVINLTANTSESDELSTALYVLITLAEPLTNKTFCWHCTLSDYFPSSLYSHSWRIHLPLILALPH